jgi:MFS family permease
MFGSRGEDPPYAAMLAGGAVLWVAAAMAFAAIREFPGETGGGASALRHAWKSLGLLRTDAAFRRFVLVRALFISSALSAPYYVVLAQSHGNGGPLLLGLFVVASGLSGLLSGPFWGRLADRSSRATMLLAAGIASATSVAVSAAAWLAPALLGELWFLPLACFVLNIGHHGIRVGRKTYVVDLAGGNRRTDYVAVSNSAIGVILLATGAAAAALSGIGIAALILLFALAGFLGVALGRSMEEAQ